MWREYYEVRCDLGQHKTFRRCNHQRNIDTHAIRDGPEKSLIDQLEIMIQNWYLF